MARSSQGAAPGYVLRSLKSGDIGHIIARHGVLYDTEYDWNIDFEIFVAGIIADFMQTFDPERERFWIAESASTTEFLGCIAIAKDPQDPQVAKLRLLLVENQARGMGLGGKLIEECVTFARSKDYLSIRLWTYSVLEGARRLYKRAGFQLIEAKPEKIEYGQRLMNEVWELQLS